MNTPIISTHQVEPESKSRSRRALLAGALGGLGAWAAAAVATRNPVRAGVDGDVVLGSSINSTATLTAITNTGGGTAFQALSTGIGVSGYSSSNVGVYGSSPNYRAVVGDSGAGIGVYGVNAVSNQPASLGWSTGFPGNGTGVQGVSGGTLPAARAKTGVYGYAAQDSSSRGVFGEATAGVGLYGKAGSGFALRTSGRIKADKVSGVASIGASKTSVIVTPGVNVTSSSFVLLTPKVKLSGRDLWFTTDASDNKFTIHMSSSRSSGTKVAWLLLG